MSRTIKNFEELSWPTKGIGSRELLLTEELQQSLKTAWKNKNTTTNNHIIDSIIDIYKYFENKLLEEKTKTLAKHNKTLEDMKEQVGIVTDSEEKTAHESQFLIEVNAGNPGKYLAKIDEALDRIQNGTYGFCKENLVPIKLGRLESVPVTPLSTEAKTQKENAKFAHKRQGIFAKKSFTDKNIQR